MDVSTDPGLWGAHDPTVVAARDGRWLMFSTDTGVAGAPGAGVQVRVSDDLEHWTWFGHAFGGVPAEAGAWSGAQGLWAPEVVQRGDEFRMYFSASTFGSRTSAIGLATAPDAGGPWTDRGIVVATRHDVDEVNAIDAAVATDADGRDWLLFGSFFGGLRILPLGADGRPVTPGDLGTPVVRRAASINGAVEGGHIVCDDASGRFFLFCSYDSLFDSYNVRVGGSDRIDGPYRDARSRELVDAAEPPQPVGTMVLTGYEAPDGTVWVAPGHSSHVRVDGRLVLVHHVRDGADPTRHRAHLRAVDVTETGWPVVSPLIGARQTSAAGRDLAGEWFVYRLEPAAATPLRPRRLRLTKADVADFAPAGRGRLTLDGVALDAVSFAMGEQVAVAGLDEQGVVVWGIRA